MKQHYCLGFLFNLDMTGVILISKNRPEWQKGKFNGVGGHIEDNENSFAAMCREYEEETGVATRSWFNVLNMYFSKAVVHVFAARDDFAFNKSRTMTDEIIMRARVEDIEQYNTIDNIPSLLKLCQCYFEHD